MDKIPSKMLEELLSREATACRRPKAFCYEDVDMIIVRHSNPKRCIPVMSIKFMGRQQTQIVRTPVKES